MSLIRRLAMSSSLLASFGLLTAAPSSSDARLRTSLGQRHLVGAAQSLAQECIDLFSTAIGGEVVGRVDVLQRNFLAVDKGKNIDGLGCLGVSSTDFLSAEHHIDRKSTRLNS